MNGNLNMSVYSCESFSKSIWGISQASQTLIAMLIGPTVNGFGLLG